MTRVTALLDRVPGSVARHARPGSRLARTLAPVVNLVIPAEPTRVVVRSGAAAGLTVVIDPRKEKMYWTGAHESAVQATIPKLVRPGECFWDVGAHIGFFSLIASGLVGETGTVVAFEPIDDNRRRLLEAIEANDVRNVLVSAAAITDEDGTRDLFEGAGSTTWSLESRGGSASRQVACRSIDSLVAEGLRPPDVIKIDVEGGELDVFRGARNLIVERHPTFLVEFHDSSRLAAAREMLCGYTFEKLGGSQWMAR